MCLCQCVSSKKVVQILWWTVECYHLFIASSATRSSSGPVRSFVRSFVGCLTDLLAGWLAGGHIGPSAIFALGYLCSNSNQTP